MARRDSCKDVQATRDRIASAGEQILMGKTTIPKVGHLIAFEDPAGNVALAMEYDSTAE